MMWVKVMLYHGTRYFKAIVRAGKVRRSPIGRKVCLTTKRSVAEYWAELDRDDDENIGYILFFRRGDLVAAGHRLINFSGDPLARIKEFEVACYSDIDFRLCTRVDALLLPVVFLPGQ
jgi:hypothetical protein